LNAEKKINATNSWNLKLIEHLDQVIEEDDTNFTKASCTLDASVKIYGYRVDDVHLTSYKVLANLNRSDNNKKPREGTADQSVELTTALEGERDEGGNEERPQKNIQRKQKRENTLEEQVCK
jgi:condensin complex subunit 2